MTNEVSRNRRLEAVFNKVAASYGSIGPNYFSYFGEKLVDHANIQKGDSILDIAFGKGASLLPALKRVGESGKCVGIDFSQEMVKETQKILNQYSLNNAKLMQMDAENLQFVNNRFSHVLCGLAITFFSDPIRAISEMHRVLVNEGTVGLSTWKKRKQGVLGKAYNKLFPSTGTTRNTDTRPDFGSVEGVSTILSKAGFKNINVITIVKTFYYKNKEEWWQEQNTNATRGLFESLEKKGLLNQFKAEAFKAINEYQDSNGIQFEAEVLLSYAQK